MSFEEGLPLYQLFSLCIMFGMHFDNVSVLLNSVAAAYNVRPFSDVKRYNYMLIMCKLQTLKFIAIKVKCSQLAL